jgi:hypothetical protein
MTQFAKARGYHQVRNEPDRKDKDRGGENTTLIPPDSLLTGKNTGGASSQNHIFATPQLKPSRFRGSYWQQKLEAAM